MPSEPGATPTGWQTIRDAALERLRSGSWAPGALIPTEAELAAEFGCARATVNRALRDLAAAGYLDRRRKAGTRVVLHPVRKATLSIPVIRHEVEARGHAYGHRLLGRVTAVPPAGVRAALGLRRGQRLLHLAALHLADGTAYAHEDRWLNAAAVPGLEALDLGVTSANEWLVGQVPYTEGRLALTAEAATAETAHHLGCAPGAPLFTLERSTWMHAVPITWVRLSYAPGYRLTTLL